MSGAPGYLARHRRGELARCAEALRALEDPCALCPRRCGARRQAGEVGFCGLGPKPRLARACHHRGEEPPLSGTRGAGTLFFAGCNLGCRFCQNHRISRDPGAGREVDAEALAEAMLGLQEAGCHNVELVTPTPAMAGILEALDIAAARGLTLPLVHNGSGYERLEVLRLLDGVVDVWLPDLKYGDEAGGLVGSGVPDYVAVSQAAVLEMHRQVGPLVVSPEGLAVRGLILRHLVLPEDLSGTGSVLGFVAMELGRRAAVSLMAQYRPPPGIPLPAPLSRSLRREEYEAAVAQLEAWGLDGGWVQEAGSVETYVPDFDREAHPFEK